jgi:hypothetical protein
MPTKRITANCVLGSSAAAFPHRALNTTEKTNVYISMRIGLIKDHTTPIAEPLYLLRMSLFVI